MRFRGWLAVVLLAALASCARHGPTAPKTQTTAGPAANSPTGVVKRFAWALQARDHIAYADLFTDDYRFLFAANDNAGNAFRASGWDRTLEAAAIRHVLSGGGALPPVIDIRVTIADVLAVQPDPRPGMNPRWHRSVRTPIEVSITRDVGGFPEVTSISGYALFYTVRGDSAFLLPARSAQGDSARWFISRWEDETLGPGGTPGLHADPARRTSMGSVKVSYLAPASPAGTR